MKGLRIVIDESKDEKIKKSFMDKLKNKAMSLLDDN